MYLLIPLGRGGQCGSSCRGGIKNGGRRRRQKVVALHCCQYCCFCCLAGGRGCDVGMEVELLQVIRVELGDRLVLEREGCRSRERELQLLGEREGESCRQRRSSCRYQGSRWVVVDACICLYSTNFLLCVHLPRAIFSL